MLPLFKTKLKEMQFFNLYNLSSVLLNYYLIHLTCLRDPKESGNESNEHPGHNYLHIHG